MTADNDDGRGGVTGEDLESVADGCGLLPHVPRSLVGSISVARILFDTNDRKHPVILPVRFGPEHTPEDVAEVAGGGIFRAQARDTSGRFLKGYEAAEFTLEGEPLDSSRGLRGGDAPPAPPPPAAPAAPPPEAPPPVLAAHAIPVASPLPGSPSLLLDVPGLSPADRAFLGRFDVLLAHTQVAAREGAAAERAAAQASVDLTKTFLEKVSAPQLNHLRDAMGALTAQLDSTRAELTTERAEHGRTRDALQRATTEAAVFRALLESGGRIVQGAPPRPGMAGVLERVLVRVIDKTAPGAIALVAAQMGVNGEELRALTDGAGGGETAHHGASAG